MLRDEQSRARLLLMLVAVLLGINLVSLSTLPPSVPKVLTGTLVILSGLGLWLSGLGWGLLLERNGEPSPTGRTSNSQGVSQSHPTTKHGSSSLLEG
jgi:hypothetical protein